MVWYELNIFKAKGVSKLNKDALVALATIKWKDLCSASYCGSSSLSDKDLLNAPMTFATTPAEIPSSNTASDTTALPPPQFKALYKYQSVVLFQICLNEGFLIVGFPFLNSLIKNFLFRMTEYEFEVGEKFSSFNELKNKIEKFKQEFSTELSILTSRKLENAFQRKTLRKERNVNESLIYSASLRQISSSSTK